MSGAVEADFLLDAVILDDFHADLSRDACIY